ncbi:MAG TPA: M12 family metallo-peptidase [Dokdonella sp.]|uniref:reprolysin-like metallopeptidase n=1 Tax=Dokdonella sp. TaxID=2291710 RepID=UPI002D805F8F|nr:M12 family metallo-peptidase [Dokdonella sp.]HET9033366.1 M12 family metallo-peptidase [Dokdonella sp.]
MINRTCASAALRGVVSTLFLLSINAVAADLASSDWRDSPAKSLPTTTDTPDSYRSLDLDIASLQSSLARQGGGIGRTLSLPKPDGGFVEFMLSDSGVLPAELQTKYPHIHSFLGVDEKGRHARIDISPLGLNAMVFDREDTWLVRPFKYGQGRDYLSFRRSAFAAGPDFFCGTDAIGQPDVLGTQSVRVTTGTTRRGYRAAVAANHNYVAAISGTNTPTVELGLAAVTIAMNRVNEVYENEFSIHMSLIPNNDLIIYPDASTDPYSNGSGALNQNTSNLNNVIGSANYDIGHVFTTGSGGVAGLGVVCGSSKARGTTGLSNPESLQSDIFYIDYVAHEMGHQFGGNHTFNNSCGGNRSGSSAYEPGSGSTIMAYAGICPPNLQSHSDPYFHARSHLEIGNFVNGSGGSCAAEEVNHASPVIATLSNHTIPANTPFALSGNASSEVPGAMLTYGWEQYDLGPVTVDINVDPGNGPIIRSLNPTSTPIRTVPNFDNLLSGATMTGEILPTTTRALNFRFSVFDNVAGGGTTESGALTLQVDSASGPFAVTEPAAGATWDPLISATELVTWDVANTAASPVSCAAVDIDVYSGGGFANSSATLALGIPNTGIALVSVPNMQSSSARVRVRCSDNIFFAISPGDFTINGPDLIFANGFD